MVLGSLQAGVQILKILDGCQKERYVVTESNK